MSDVGCIPVPLTESELDLLVRELALVINDDYWRANAQGLLALQSYLRAFRNKLRSAKMACGVRNR